VIAVAAPPIWGVVRPAPPVPSSIRELYVPDKVNIVEFADFECPFCRLLHPVMKSVLSRYPEERIHFVRMNFPLPANVHPNALPAARAHVCAEAQGKGEVLADVLFRIDLEPRAIRRAAVATGLDVRAFDACIADTKTDARIEEQQKRLKDAGMQGLPTTYIGGERLVGLVDEADLIDAIESAARDESGHGVPTPLYLALIGALVAVVVWLGRARAPRSAATTG
jgi:protein-disulfide isomerase